MERRAGTSGRALMGDHLSGILQEPSPIHPKLHWIRDRLKFQNANDAFYAAFTFFFIFEFFIDSFFVWQLMFYLLIAPLLFVVIRSQQWRDWLSPATVAILAFFLYFAASLLWSPDWQWAVSGRWIWRTLITLVFIAAAIVFCAQDRRSLERYLDAMIAACLIAGIVSIAHHVAFGETAGRMSPIGLNDHQVVGAFAYGALGVLALCQVHQPVGWRKRLFYGAAAGVAGLVILLTISRGPLIAFGITVLFILIAYRSWRTIAIVAVSGLAFVVTAELLRRGMPTELQLAAPGDLLPKFLTRAPSMRPEIWAYAIEHVEASWMFGHGLTAPFDFPYSVPITHPHSMYVSALYYGGVVGLLLLLTVAAALVFELRGVSPRHYRILMAATLLHGLLAGVPDLARLATSLSPVWLFLWLPAALIIGDGLRKRVGNRKNVGRRAAA